MQNGKCPNCGEQKVVTSKNGIQTGEASGVFVFVSNVASVAAVNSYVCTSCGYLQLFLADPQMLTKIAASERWAKVG